MEIAEYNVEDKAFNTIYYSSINDLSSRTGITVSTLNRILKDNGYSEYLTIDRKQKIIKLYNSFAGARGIPFIKLTEREAKSLIVWNDNLLCKYFIYIKYYCDKEKGNDFTAKQFLSASGYKTTSNNYLSLLSEYNRKLQENNFISIQSYRDSKGHTRNIYTTTL